MHIVRNTLTLTSCLLVVLIPSRAIAQEATEREWQTNVRIGGIGGLYLLPEPGELWVEIEKSDLNRSGRPAHLRAILFGPDRAVLDEQWLPDDEGAKGTAGPVQRVRLNTAVTRTGVYGVNITVTNDRYGEEIAWGFRTNCPRYLIETSRGHKDAAHEEPLVLLNPDAAGDVAFLPRQGAFSLEVRDIPESVQALTVYGPDGAEAGVLAVAEGEASGRFDAAAGELRPWRLHMPAFAGTVHIDGVTRWSESDRFQHFSLWTPEIKSWSPLHRYRWLLTPYHRTAYSESVEENAVEFQVHNNDLEAHTVALSLEFPENAPDGSASVPASRSSRYVHVQARRPHHNGSASVLASIFDLSTRGITVPSGESVPVTVRYQVPDEGDEWVCYLRATPDADPAMATYSKLVVRRGAAPAYEPLAMPIVLEPYRHENAQFGYLPDYPLSNQPHFDIHNRPVIADKRAFHIQRDGAWISVAQAAQPGAQPAPFEFICSKVAFDAANGLYLLARQAEQPVLLHLHADARVPTAYVIPGGGSFDIEQFSGHNAPGGPPPFARFTLTEKDPDLFWRRLNDLHVFFPEKDAEDVLTLGEPVLVSRKCIGYSGHSGMPSTLVSRDGKTHVVWAEATEPEEKVEGVPTFVATYDSESATLGAPAIVGYGPPANDVHNTPSITMDSRGYLHVLVGTHGRTFRYACSLAPNDAGGGWTEPVELGPGLRQTYVGLVCDRDDALHVVFRLWRTDTDYFPAGHYAALAYMTKPRDGEWTEPRPLIVSPFSEYSVFYHRLTIDRQSRLFLSYDYWTTHWFYRTDHWGDRRALLMSEDGGQSWKLASRLPQ